MNERRLESPVFQVEDVVFRYGAVTALDGFSFNGRPAKDPMTDTTALTSAIAAWMKEVIWAAADQDALPPEQLIKELTWDRRHMFQSAGLYDELPWRVV